MVDPKHLKTVRNWAQATYPSVNIDPDWLEQATDYVVSSAAEPPTATSLIKAVHFQLLHADLRQLVLPGSNGGFAAALRVQERKSTASSSSSKAPLTVDQVVKGRIAPPPKGVGGKATVGKRSTLLVQIVGLTDVGVSAQALLDVSLARQQARKTEAGRRMLEDLAEGRAGDRDGERARTRSVSPAKGGGGGGGGGGGARGATPGAAVAGAGAEDEDAGLAAEEDMVRSSIVYPRSMLSLELDDGYIDVETGAGARKPVRALEMQRIPELGIGRTELGCKLLISDAEVSNGMILLTPQNVTVKGGSVMELQEGAEDAYIKRLQKHLGKAAGGGAAAGPAGDARRRGISPIKSVSPEKRRGAAAAPRAGQKRGRDAGAGAGAGGPSAKAQDKGKGKARADPPPPPRRQQQRDEFDEFDEFEDEDADELMRDAIWEMEDAQANGRANAQQARAPKSAAQANGAGAKGKGKGKQRAIDVIDLDDFDDDDEFNFGDLPELGEPTQVRRPHAPARSSGRSGSASGAGASDDPIVIL